MHYKRFNICPIQWFFMSFVPVMCCGCGLVIFTTQKLNNSNFHDMNFDWAFFLIWISLMGCVISCALMMLDFHNLTHLNSHCLKQNVATAQETERESNLVNAVNRAVMDTANKQIRNWNFLLCGAIIIILKSIFSVWYHNIFIVCLSSICHLVSFPSI